MTLGAGYEVGRGPDEALDAVCLMLRDSSESVELQSEADRALACAATIASAVCPWML